MKKKRLLTGEKKEYKAKDIAVFEDRDRLKAVLSKLYYDRDIEP